MSEAVSLSLFFFFFFKLEEGNWDSEVLTLVTLGQIIQSSVCRPEVLCIPYTGTHKNKCYLKGLLIVSNRTSFDNS